VFEELQRTIRAIQPCWCVVVKNNWTDACKTRSAEG